MLQIHYLKDKSINVPVKSSRDRKTREYIMQLTCTILFNTGVITRAYIKFIISLLFINRYSI